MTDDNIRENLEQIEAEALLRAQYSETGFLWQCITTVFAALAVYVLSVKEFLASTPCYNNYPLLLIGNFLAIILLWVLNRISIISGYSFRQWQIVLARIRIKHRLFDCQSDGMIPSRWSQCSLSTKNKSPDLPEYQKFFACFSIVSIVLVFAITFILLRQYVCECEWLLWYLIEFVLAVLILFCVQCYWKDRQNTLAAMCKYNRGLCYKKDTCEAEKKKSACWFYRLILCICHCKRKKSV